MQTLALFASRPPGGRALTIFSGHTHLRRDERLDPTRFINPGALYRAQTFTVGLLDLASDEYVSLAIGR